MDKIGVIHGRFQMLHNGHLEYLLAGKKRCAHLIIGICNPDMHLTKFSSANPHRSLKSSNPLTFFERFQMIKGSLLEAGIPLEEFDIVPFPVNFPELLFNYAPKKAKYYMTIYDQWGIEKKQNFEKLGCDVDVMWTMTNEDKCTSGSEVRALIKNGGEWRHLVPRFVYNYVIENKIDIRIKNMGIKE